MKYADIGFRAVYHNFAVFPLTPATKGALAGFPGEEMAEGVLTYGYYDRECGITLEVLAAARKGENGWRFADGNDEIRSFIRIDAVKEEELFLLQDPKGSLPVKYAKKLEMLKSYNAEEAVEKTRTLSFLDGSRHPEYIDDVMVYLHKNNLKTEGCWARIIGLGEHRIWGKLLNEPEQDFGIHAGEDFTFTVDKDEKTGKVTCHAQFSVLVKMKPEDLADGRLLKEAIHRYHEDPDGDALFDIFQILRDSNVWIPCSAVVADEDRKAMEQMIKDAGDDLDSLVGKEFTAGQQIRLVPDILENDGESFFPVFAAEEDMGEYGEHFSKVQQSFMDVIKTARNDDRYETKLTGIVINAFTEPFVLPEGLYEAVEKAESRLE